jgi:hypothetical protein
MAWAMRLAGWIVLLLALGSVAARAGEAARWVQYAADGAAEARLATDAPQCPALTIDGRAVPMTERAPPDGDFALRLCAAVLPAGARTVATPGGRLPVPATTPGTIVVVGDTGCRVLGPSIQDCNDPSAWPFAAVARRAAGLQPDLVIHVGDYLYRETPCPPGLSRCAGSPSGDNWPTWNADFFKPAGPLLAAAPFVFVRGNHETCARAGAGWLRLLGPGRNDATSPCVAHLPPYAINAGRLDLVVVDAAEAADTGANPTLTGIYAADAAAVARLAHGPSWLVMHRPLRGVVRLASGAVVGGNDTMLPTLGANLPASIELLLSGHIHAFEVIDYDGEAPPQLIAGNGGDLLDAAPADLAGIVVGGVKIARGLALPGFGFLEMSRNATGWRIVAYDVSGKRLRQCQLAERRIACQKT